MTLTYLGVHAVFVLPVLALLLWRRPALPAERRRTARAGLLLMGTVAFAYTTPWDNLLIERGAWTYGEGRTLAHVWAAPVGEYLFFALQTALVGLWLYRVDFDPTPVEGDMARAPRALGALAWLSLAAVGGWLVLAGPTRFLYLGAILAWACPVLALQWGVGGAFLLRRLRPVAVAVGVPTLYLWVVDRVAIADGVWAVAAETSTGVHLLGLPVEEAVFFLVASALVVNGLVLFEWALLRFRSESAGDTESDRPRTLDDGTGSTPGTALGTDDGADAVATDDDPTPIAD
ncbi:lycopene cyclase domain-containing protein [Halobaculum sp. WSA2]|uniref:Lycopene cyclase domain-containing protein n=1 Tax=Halobaculum saliterrae TaxID=2073113 RepID=A0A6B0T594_9EURY|nr:lycopene cyclase domain-containing protein [Halobaculum saliterrae]MXR41669.1 lycopene cyclase domain-containing protein [Halobaculum saliterrae]